MFQRKVLLIFGAITFALASMYPGAGALQGTQALHWEQWQGVPNHQNPFWWAQIDFTKLHDVPWDDSDFAALAQSGVNGVELNMDWADIEPQKDQYDFKLIDRYMAEAAKVHLKLYLLFWECVWGQRQGKNPAPWITARDVSSDGVPALEPPWWDEASRKAYFDYIAHTIDHVKSRPGFGGVYPSYGWLDSEWGPAPKGSHGVTGYAPEDIQAFYRWLPQTYKTLADFNHQWHTSYHTWKDVPVGRPGDPMFAVYQRFRQYSAEEGFDAVTRVVREHTNATLIYSWGGGIDGRIGPEVQGNDPDMFFRLAKKYHVVVNLDDSNTAGLALVFGGLVRSYRSPMINEWTPWRKDLRAEIPEYLGHMGLNAPFAIGANWFIYPPPPQHPGFVEGWKAYQEWHETLTKVIRGVAPAQPVAVIVPLRKISLSTDLNVYPNLTPELGDFWEHHHVLPHFISDEQVARGIVSLQQFRAVVDLGDEVSTLPALKRYAKNHPVLKSLDQALPYLRPYVTLDPAYDSLEATPTVEGSSVWLELGNCNDEQGYSGTIRFDPTALGLRSAGSFSVKDAKTGRPISATRSEDRKIQWRVNLPRAGFQVVQISLANSAAR
jgi:Beta-galactosidase